MWLYFILFIIPLGVYISNNKKLDNKNPIFLFYYLLFLALFVGLSDMLGGYDRYIYGEVFDSIADITTRHESYFAHGAFLMFENEPGYIILNILISFVTENRYIFIFIYTCIVYCLLYISLKEYAKNYPLALMLFMGLWFFFTFTYLRQVLGATIIWLGIKYIIDRKFWKFILVFLTVLTIHKSAIIFFPMYFIPIKKYSVSSVITVMIIALLIGLSPLPNALFNAYGDSSVIEQHADYSASGSARFAYLLEVIIFLSIILSKYYNIGKEKIDIEMLNIALGFCASLLLFIRSDNGGRLSWYYMIGIIVTLSNICNKLHKQSVLSIGVIIICLFLYIRVYNNWQDYLNLYPYKTFLTNGYRQGDYSHKHYEYDARYDTDKLYRKPLRIKFNLRK